MLRTLRASLLRALIAAGLMLLATPALAAEGDAIDVNVTVVHARPAAGGVAPELDGIGRYLLKAFPNHKSFVRLSARDEHLAVGAEGRLALPNKSELVIKHTGWKDGFAAVYLQVGGLSSTVNVKDGSTFFQAGRGYEGGMIVLAIQVRSSR